MKSIVKWDIIALTLASMSHMARFWSIHYGASNNYKSIKHISQQKKRKRARRS